MTLFIIYLLESNALSKRNKAKMIMTMVIIMHREYGINAKWPDAMIINFIKRR